MHNKPLLIVMLKNPLLGHVKTRLAATIGDNKALEVYKALYAHTLSLSQSDDWEVHFHYSEQLPEQKIANASYFTQCKGDLGDRMLEAFDLGFAKHQKCVMIGADCYTLTQEDIATAFDALDAHDIVLGPADDGGYYLIGMNTFSPYLLHDMPWSQNNLLSQTISKAQEHKLSLSLMDKKNDIDTIDDLLKHPELYQAINSVSID